MQNKKFEPVQPQERIQTIDIIRGFALFGILIINFTVDANNTAPWDGWTGFADQFFFWTISLFMDDKFMSIYCLLFGLGFTLQMQRAKAGNTSFAFVYLRRMIILYVIGAAQQILTNGSILPIYAMYGVLLLLFWKLPIKLLPIIALICFVAPWVRQAINQMKTISSSDITSTISVDSSLLKKYEGVYEISPGRRVIVTIDSKGLMSHGRGGKVPLIALSQTEFLAKRAGTKFLFVSDSTGKVTEVVLQQGSDKTPARKIEMSIEQGKEEMAPKKITTYNQFVKRNAIGFWNGLISWSWKNFIWHTEFVAQVMVLFLLGMYAGRRKVFSDIPANRNFLKKVMYTGLITGFIFTLMNLGWGAFQYVKSLSDESISFSYKIIINTLGRLGFLLLSLGYIAGLTLLAEKIDWKKKLAFFAPVGRMGLTNYILHSIVTILIFPAFSLGLGGKIGCFYRLLIAIPICFLMYFLSRWWFRHFRIGPAEWLWRSLTYLKFQPMRLKAANKTEEKER
ncbi:MAG: DUF418 domain-containing protein [Ferruginibacter sp.]